MRFLFKLLILSSIALTNFALAQAEYNRIELEIDIDRPAAEVWSKVGTDFCQVSEWLPLDCEIISGDGGIGTVRVLAGGRVTEILIAQTELSYGYTLPFVEGEFNSLYHGFMEARPVSNSTSKMIYTLVYDRSNITTQAERDAHVEQRTAAFQGALANMKALAEAD